MKIRINIDKIAALNAGKDRHGLAVVEIPAADLSTEQRSILAKYTYSTQDEPRADFYLDEAFRYTNTPFFRYTNTPFYCLDKVITEPDAEQVKVLLEKMVEAKKVYDEKEAVKIKAREAEDKANEEKAKKRLAEWCALPLENRVQRWTDGHWEVSRDDGDARGTPEYAEAKAEAERRNNLAKAAAEKKAAEEKARKEAGIKTLKTWAKANGSDLLKARIEDGFEWIGLAEQEYANALVADLGPVCEEPFDSEDVDVSDRTTPTLEEIQALRTAKEKLAGKDNISVELNWVKYTQEADPEDYPEDDDLEESLAVLRVNVTCPTGRVIFFDYLPETLVAVK